MTWQKGAFAFDSASPGEIARLMSLFHQLHDDIFLIFSRANRHLYALLIVELFDRFFSDTVTFPGRQEVVGHIYDTLRSHPDLWHEDGEDFSAVADIRTGGRRIRRARGINDGGRQDLLLDRAQRAYWRLVETGWLEEESFGLKITVDMPPSAMLLAERLAAIQCGLATSFRGVVVTIRNALASVLIDATTNAVGLNKAAEMAITFSRELRAVLSTLRSIERDILDAGSLGSRLATFFEDFIGRLVLKDFESIYKTNHPYRFKREILGYVDQISDDGHYRSQVIEGYVEGEVARRTEAGCQLDADLLTLRTVFDNIDSTYDRINAFRIRLEGRLRNTVKYAEMGDHQHSQRLSTLLARLDGAVGAASPDWLARRQPEGMVLADTPLWAAHLLAEPRAPRVAVEAGALRRPQTDPVLAVWRAMARRYNDMFVVDPHRVLRFLEQRVLPNAIAEARHLALTTVEDFLAFEQLRRYRHSAPEIFLGHFEILPSEDVAWRDDDWLRCENFLIRRKTDIVTLIEENPQ
jgi:hypothetical protein